MQSARAPRECVGARARGRPPPPRGWRGACGRRLYGDKIELYWESEFVRTDWDQRQALVNTHTDTDGGAGEAGGDAAAHGASQGDDLTGAAHGGWLRRLAACVPDLS